MSMLRNGGDGDNDGECQGISANYAQIQNLVNFSFFPPQELCASVDVHGSFCFITRDDPGVGILLDQMAAGESG